MKENSTLKEVANNYLTHTEKNKGITLLVLVITTVVLLILSGITVSMLTGENGIIKKTREAKEQTEIDGEKEIVETSLIQTMGKNKYGNVVQSELEEKLNSNAGIDRTEVIDNGDTLVVKFVESGRYYEVDNDGNVSEPIEIVMDEYAGDITKGGKYNGSSEEMSYQINCIEDLVAFSQSVNSGNDYANMYVKLMRTLDFNSIFSYNNCSTTEYDEYLGGNGTNELKKQLSQLGNGFVPIGNIYDINFKGFRGTFDGCNYKIKNIYIKQESNSGLFGYINGAKVIQNLGVSGKIIATNGMSGGLIGQYNIGASGIKTLIKNCYNEADIYSYGGTTVYWSTQGSAGGIIGIGGELTIDGCYNKGTVTGEMSAGGIIGQGRRNRYH